MPHFPPCLVLKRLKPACNILWLDKMLLNVHPGSHSVNTKYCTKTMMYYVCWRCKHQVAKRLMWFQAFTQGDVNVVDMSFTLSSGGDLNQLLLTPLWGWLLLQGFWCFFMVGIFITIPKREEILTPHSCPCWDFDTFVETSKFPDHAPSLHPISKVMTLRVDIWV